MVPVSTQAASREKIHHPPTEALDLATIMRTLGDPIRLEMVRILADGRQAACGELSAELGLPASTGSYHMRLLREAGLTRALAAGTQRLISLRREVVGGGFAGPGGVL